MSQVAQQGFENAVTEKKAVREVVEIFLGTKKGEREDSFGAGSSPHNARRRKMVGSGGD
jgi:hypothetical protein